MKIIRSIFLVLFSLIISQFAQANNELQEGRQLYKTYCSACHGFQDGMDMSKRLAPPVIAVKMHYIRFFPDKESFVNAVANWVEKQDAGKSLMRGAIRKFNIMPPVAVAREDAQKIAAYIYEGELDTPAAFEEHYQQRHGKGGMNQGM